MIPLYFGPSHRALWGVYHRAAEAGPRRGLVICGPIDEQEYYNAHRTCRLLAQKLAASGVHVLRFDYLGTGDSAGEADDFGMDDWREDVRLAMEELRDVAEVREVGLIGIRGGATLALDAAIEAAHGTRVGLWGPLVDDAPSRRDSGPTVGGVLARSQGPMQVDVLVLTNGEDPESDSRACSALKERGASVRHVHHHEVGPWASSAGNVMAVASLATLVGWARSS